MADTDVNFLPISSVFSDSFVAPQPPQTYQLKAPKTGSYSRCYLSYNRGTPDKPIIDEALFELTICKGVVEEKPNEDGSVGWQLHLQVADPNDQAGLDRAYMGCAKIVGLYKGMFGQPMFNPDAPYGVLKNPLYRSVNKQTGAIIDGATPSLWCKIDKKSAFKEVKVKRNADGQPIIDSNGDPEVDTPSIDYKTLKEKDLTVSVILHYSNIYKGSTISPQVMVRSCAILQVSGAGHVDHTKSNKLTGFLKTQMTQDPAYFDNLAKEFEKLRTQAPKPTAGPSLLKPADQSQASGMPPGFPGQLQIGAPPGFPPQQQQVPQQLQQQPTQQFQQPTQQQPYQQQPSTVPSTPGPAQYQPLTAPGIQYTQPGTQFNFSNPGMMTLPGPGQDMGFFQPQTVLGHQ